MQIKPITTIEGLKSIEAGWLKLLQHPCNSGIHQEYDWFWCAYQAFHSNDQLYVLVFADDNKNLLGIAPLIVFSGTYRGIRVKKIGFAKNEQSPANDFIFTPGLEERFLEMALDHLAEFRQWDFVHLQLVNMEGPTGTHLQKLLAEKDYLFGMQSNRQSPYILIDGCWEDYCKGRSKKFKKTMRNNLNRAKKQEDLVIEKIPVTARSEPALSDILRISKNSWKKDIGKDLVSRQNDWQFYKDICDRYGPSGCVFIWMLKVNQVGVAFEFHLEYKNVVYPIRADFDEHYKEISPGSILEWEILKRLFCENSCVEYNSCGHTYDYLLKLTNNVRNHQNFEIFNRKLKMKLLYNFEYRFMVWLREKRIYRIYRAFRKDGD